MRILLAATWIFGLYLIATGQGDPIAHGVQHLTDLLANHPHN